MKNTTSMRARVLSLMLNHPQGIHVDDIAHHPLFRNYPREAIKNAVSGLRKSRKVQRVVDNVYAVRQSIIDDAPVPRLVEEPVSEFAVAAPRCISKMAGVYTGGDWRSAVVRPGAMDNEKYGSVRGEGRVSYHRGNLIGEL